MSQSAPTLSVPPSAWGHLVASGSLSGALATQITITGFVSGHSFFPNHWWHLGWLLIVGLCAFVRLDWGQILARRQVDTGALLVVAFLLWMTLRSCFSDVQVSVENWIGLTGTVLLAMFCTLVWQQADDSRAMATVGRIMGLTSAFAALVSLVFSYFILATPPAGERLSNLLVHGGLNPVCTGLIFGFAALWLAALGNKDAPPNERRILWSAGVLLHFATFLSGSRGAMLALLCGHAALMITRGWRRGAPALSIFLVTGIIYFAIAPLQGWMSSMSPNAESTSFATSIPHPLKNVVERGDSGRFEIYRAGWNSMDDRWFGLGQWGVRDIWQCDLQPLDASNMSHLHSGFFATFVHGGVIGVVLLAALLAIGFQRAWRSSRGGDGTWFALLAFGCGGLIFDGESLTSLTTAPRFEGLIFWLPLIVVLATGGHRSLTRTAMSRRQSMRDVKTRSVMPI